MSVPVGMTMDVLCLQIARETQLDSTRGGQRNNPRESFRAHSREYKIDGHMKDMCVEGVRQSCVAKIKKKKSTAFLLHQMRAACSQEASGKVDHRFDLGGAIAWWGVVWAYS